MIIVNDDHIVTSRFFLIVMIINHKKLDQCSIFTLYLMNKAHAIHFFKALFSTLIDAHILFVYILMCTCICVYMMYVRIRVCAYARVLHGYVCVRMLVFLLRFSRIDLCIRKLKCTIQYNMQIWYYRLLDGFFPAFCNMKLTFLHPF